MGLRQTLCLDLIPRGIALIESSGCKDSPPFGAAINSCEVGREADLCITSTIKEVMNNEYSKEIQLLERFKRMSEKERVFLFFYGMKLHVTEVNLN